MRGVFGVSWINVLLAFVLANVAALRADDFRAYSTSATLDGPVVLSGRTTFDVSAGATVTVAVAVSGVGPLVKTGPGALRLTRAGSYVGGTVVSNGMLAVTCADALGPTNQTLHLASDGATGFGALDVDFAGTFPYPIHTDACDAFRAEKRYANLLVEQSATFAGAIDGRRLAPCAVHGGAVTFDCAVDLPEGLLYISPNGGTVTFARRVRVRELETGHGTDTSFGTVVWRAPDNEVAHFCCAYRNHMFEVPNALGTNVVVSFLTYREHVRSVLNLGTYDQTIDSFVAHPGTSTLKPIGNRVVASGRRNVTLTVRPRSPDAVCVSEAMYEGPLALVFNPVYATATFATEAAAGRRMAMTGDLVVSNGVFTVNGTNSFPCVPRLVVGPGATFRHASTQPYAYLNVASLELAAGATFSVDASAAAPFVAGRPVCSIASSAQLVLANGKDLVVAALRVDGAPLPAGTYTRANASWISGPGRVVVPAMPLAVPTHEIAVPARDGALAAALDAVAAIRRTNEVSALVLALAPGVHAVPAPLVFGSSHARIEWPRLVVRAADPAHPPRLVAGTRLAIWTKGQFPGRSDVWTADASALEGTTWQRGFSYDGALMTPARWPNAQPTRPITGGFARVRQPVSLPDGLYKSCVGQGCWNDEVPVAATDVAVVAGWSNPSEGFVVVSPRHNWHNTVCAIRGFADGVLRLDASHVEQTATTDVWERWYVQNVREALDLPGEWYYDASARRIHFIPPDGSDPNARDARAETAKNILVLESANIALEHLELVGGAAPLTITGSDIVVRGCRVHDAGFPLSNGHYGPTAVLIKGRRIRFADCDVWNIDGNGVGVSSPFAAAIPVDERQEVRIENCYVHHCGVGALGATGISLGSNTQGVEVFHNFVHDCARNGIGWNGRFNEIAYNRVRHIGYASDDTACMYGGGWMQGVGVRIHHNHVSDAIGYHYGGDRTYSFGHLASGIYPDEGSGGLEIFCNFIANCHNGGMHLHNGRWTAISNNVFVSNSSTPPSSSSHQLSLQSWNDTPGGTFSNRLASVLKEWRALVDADSRWLDFPAVAQRPDDHGAAFTVEGYSMMGNQVVDNIFYYPDQSTTRLCSGVSLSTTSNRFDRNIYWPGSATAFRTTARNSQTYSWSAWQAEGEDLHSVVADPRFVDAAHGDWRLAADSPAHARGIVELPFDEMGLVTNDVRTALPAEAVGVREHPEWFLPADVTPVTCVDVVWTGAGGDDHPDTRRNWRDLAATPDWWRGDVHAIFADGDDGGSLDVPFPMLLWGLSLTDGLSSFAFRPTAANARLRLCAGGISAGTAARAACAVPVELVENQTWTLGANASLALSAPLVGFGTLCKAGEGTLSLACDHGGLSGAVVVSNGSFYVSGADPLGPAASLVVDSVPSGGKAQLYLDGATISGAVLRVCASWDMPTRPWLHVVGATTNAIMGPLVDGTCNQIYVDNAGGTLVFGGGGELGYMNYRINGTLVVTNRPFAGSTLEGTVMNFVLHAAGNRITRISGTGNPPRACMAVGLDFRVDNAFDLAGCPIEEFCLSRTMKLNGHSQRIGSLRMASGTQVASDGGAATLFVDQKFPYEVQAVFAGGAGLAKAGESALALTAASTSTGTVAVTAGVLVFTNAASWRAASAATVAGTGRLEAWNADVFGDATDLRIDDAGVYAFAEAASGGVQRVRTLRLDGRFQPAGLYCAVDCANAPAGCTRTAHLAGNGLLRVLRDPNATTLVLFR